MTIETTAKYLATFPRWLAQLGQDAEVLASVLDRDDAQNAGKEAIAGGLNYLFKSLDLIPDGVDDIGYLDDAFVLRVSAALALADSSVKAEPATLARLNQLAGDCDLLREFLATDYLRFENYVKGLRHGAARGRAVSSIVTDEDVRGAFLTEVTAFARTYRVPSFSPDERHLVKLRAYFDAKLPK